jgi:hypothetical protein
MQNDAEIRLSEKQDEVAHAVARDELSNEAIAQEFKIGRATLDRWKLLPEFTRRVTEIRKAKREALLAKTIANIEFRVDALIDRQGRMRTVISERGEFYKRANEEGNPRYSKVPGAETGLLCHEEKLSKYGSTDLYKVDVALLREMRETEKQLAIELGEWSEKREVTGKDGKDLFPNVEAAIEKIYGDKERTSENQASE